MKQKKKWTVKNIVGIICFVTLLFSIGFSICKIFGAPADPAEAQPHERLKSDYVLMLAQCLLGCIVLFLPNAIERHFKIDIPKLYGSVLLRLPLLRHLPRRGAQLFLHHPLLGHHPAHFQRRHAWASSGSRSWTS